MLNIFDKNHNINSIYVQIPNKFKYNVQDDYRIYNRNKINFRFSTLFYIDYRKTTK